MMEFFKEIILISSIRHPNILLNMGICIKEEKLLLISEFYFIFIFFFHY